MKTLVSFLLCLSLCSILKAQEDSVIKISAMVTHKDSAPLYKAMVIVGAGYSSLPSEVMSLDSLKSRYKAAIEDAGFSWDNLHENPNGFGYETMSKNEDGTIYEYSTSSIGDMRKFMKIRPLGVESIYVVSVIEIDTKETEHLTQLVIKQATAKATAIAQAMHVDLGDVIRVEDVTNRWGNTIETSVYYDKPANECKYIMDVTFKIKHQ